MATAEPDLRVRWIIDDALERLPLEIYEGLLERGEESVRIVFTYSRGDCRLLTGDLDALLGGDLTEQDLIELGTAAYNTALEFAEPVRFVNEPDKIDYALAVSALIVPGSSDVHLLASETELAFDDDSDCSQSKRYRRKAIRLATRNLNAPTVRPGVSSDLVTFYSWDREGGDVRSHEVLLSPAGEVELEVEPIATHAGDHECAASR